MNRNIFWSVLFILAFVAGCKDDDDDAFAGDDNFITSFILTQNARSYEASFKGDTIL